MFTRNILTRLFFIPTLIFILISCSSNGQRFKIDPTISNSIDSIFKENVLFNSPVKSEFSFHVVKTFDYEKFNQGGMDLPYFLKGDSYEESDQYVNSTTQCYLSKDTIVLVGGLFYNSCIGFRITIFDDRFYSQLILTATDEIYSKTDKKDDLTKEIILNSDSLSMTLTQTPVYKNGSVVKGKLKVKSQLFYQLDKANKLFKIEPEFDIVFDTKVKEMERD